MAGIEDVLGAFGFTTDIALTASAAIADPTSANIDAVVNAYAANGQVPPTKLYAYLIQINEEKHPEDTVRGNVFPWVIAGGLLAGYWLLFGRKSRRGKVG
jgi:hypothetical protein